MNTCSVALWQTLAEGEQGLRWPDRVRHKIMKAEAGVESEQAVTLQASDIVGDDRETE